MTRALSFAFGLVMVAAGAAASAPAASVVAFVGVVLGVRFGAAAVVAVVATAAGLALADPSVPLTALAGLAAAAYLVLRYGGERAMTTPTVLAAVGLCAVAGLGSIVPAGVAWIPLLAPLAVLASYAIVMNQFAS